ncbi:hypothetical protein E3_1920 [Rhodococcus phage E3]|uniref:hypothetical protein n=1 Tax=Rhodococcus phage E3 TaxID=1007869 RepID=UPI0002C6BBFF|nr:hypothetical protein M176_gp204 [Rhodococcus phage E3]AEQ21112.1 hypothetical protein E3_1920 [Rhodococcus phage E3]
MAEYTKGQARLLNKINATAVDLRDRYGTIAGRAKADLQSLDSGYRPAGIPGELLAEIIALQAELEAFAVTASDLGITGGDVRLALSDPDFKAEPIEEDA